MLKDGGKNVHSKIPVEGEMEFVTGKRVLIAIAHPDDESMFFLPMIRNIVRENDIYLLCFSNGNYEGFGKQREKELKNVCGHLGIAELIIIEHEELQDGISENWNTTVITDIAKKFVIKNNIEIVGIVQLFLVISRGRSSLSILMEFLVTQTISLCTQE
jgi:LmbE family N-acetylglucosaminyl deacetylase